MPIQHQGEIQDCLAGGGEMGALMRSIDGLTTSIGPVATWSPALRTDAPRLREAAHKLHGLVSVFSRAAGARASDLEDHAARSRLDEAGLLVERLETMAQELSRQVDALSREDPRALHE